MTRILVTEELAPRGLDVLAAAGHEVDVRLGLSHEALVKQVVGARALVIRSATTVDAAVLAAGRDLVVVGRAGVGVDNVDVAEATRRGVMVVNAPESNILSAAELTIALLLAQARNIPQAHAALVAGRWERSRWEGTELYGKTLGVVGLGRIGALVAQRALALGMHLVAHDPYVAAERAKKMGIELTSLEDLVARCDFITIHLPKTPDTVGLFGKELLARVKIGVRIVNAARGGIIDEDALAQAIRDGRVGGAAIDVFATEPTTVSPLFDLPSVVVTPHLGASTNEAQDKAGEQVAEQVVLALAGDFVPYAVNVDAGVVSETVRPFLGISEILGRFMAALSGGLPDELTVECQGALASEDVSILTLAVLKGLFATVTDEPVSYVNARQIAEERGLVVHDTQTTSSPYLVSVITVRSSRHSISATLVGGAPRLVEVDAHSVEIPPADVMVVVHNDDRPGMIGIVGTALGDAGISIVNMAVGQTAGGKTALMVLATDRSVPEEVLAKLRRASGILDVCEVTTV
ncbi:MAG TPA: phosphoglycerate dehydrogenase [Acidimicrobiales bacterium]|nr:phosphoglycerate dehydrogenase [Acidimicrobiales bacterium]